MSDEKEETKTDESLDELHDEGLKEDTTTVAEAVLPEDRSLQDATPVHLLLPDGHHYIIGAHQFEGMPEVGEEFVADFVHSNSAKNHGKKFKIEKLIGPVVLVTEVAEAI